MSILPSHIKAVSLTCLLLGFGCRTAEFKSVPNQRQAVPKAGEVVSEEVTTKIAPAEPRIVVNPSPIVESELIPQPWNIVTEKFAQESSRGSADILIVIDDSSSMVEEQKNLSTKMNALVESLKGVDWQIGVVTTTRVKDDDPEKCKIKMIRSSDSDPDAKFKKAIVQTLAGSNKEEGIFQAVMGLKCPNAPWVRKLSTVAVLIVSDEDDCGSGPACSGTEGKFEKYLTDYVETTLGRTVGKNAGFYGIYSPPGKTCPLTKTANVYQRLVDYKVKNQENYGRICDPNYQTTLQKISKNIADQLRKTFDLTATPVAGSLTIEGIKADGQKLQVTDLEIVDRVMSFKSGQEPKPNSEFIVRYEPVAEQ